MNKAEKRVLVGMSGGIDSTATCLMLREQGYEIVGLTMWCTVNIMKWCTYYFIQECEYRNFVD